MDAPGTVIDTLHVRARGAGLALRLRLASLLGGADLHPAGLSPSAVLVVRSVPDPLPGRLAPGGPAARVDPAWERAVREALDRCCRRAARPTRGVLPASAEAVLFADEAEMLACLLLDLAHGRAGERWWWKALLRALRPVAPPDRAGTVLYRKPCLVPPVLALLAAWGRAVDVVRRFTPAQALAILHETLAAFEVGLGDLRPPVRPAPPAHEAARQEDTAAVRQDGLPARAAPAPWSAAVPERDFAPGLSVEQELLLGVGLALHRMPALVRSAAFRVALGAWIEARPGPPPPPERARPPAVPPAAPPHAAPRPAEQVGPLAPRQPGTRARAEPHVDVPITSGPASPEGDTTPPAAPPARPVVPDAKPVDVAARITPVEPSAERGVAGAVEAEAIPARRRAAEAHLHTAGDVAPREEAAGTAMVPAPAVSGSSAAGDGAAEAPEAADPAQPYGAGGVDTRLGGVLYLINLMGYLDLPGCFEPDWHLGAHVGPWALVEALAGALLGPSGAAYRHDPLRRVLADLDGRRPGERVGEGLGDPPFRLPPVWRRSCEAGPWRWAARDGRFRLWTGGVLLAEGPRDGRPSRGQAADAAAALGLDPGTPLRRGAFDEAPGGPLDLAWDLPLHPAFERWLRLVLPFVRWRLGAALGEVHPEALLCRPGRLYVTSSHVDLVMPLHAVSLPVRRAGLDRDPGWLPAFGRVVLFHFDDANINWSGS